ncbi:MAG TPA: GNAT family protein [Gemmatimonadaceae bacterium]|nr:GNAT family protein [Gemmatimonadaceae bacterium]
MTEGIELKQSELPTLVASNLHLRALTRADIPALFSIFGDPEVTRYWSHPALATEEDAAKLLDHITSSFKTRSLFQWGLARREDNLVIGTCTLAGLDRGHRRAELGFALARAEWGKGLMAEMLPILVDFAFGPLSLHRLEADVDPRNAASLCTLERLGFRKEGYLRERYHVGGETQDSVLLGLLAAEWLNFRSGDD